MLDLKALTIAVVIGVLTPMLPIHLLYESQVLAETQAEGQTEADRLLEQGNQHYNISQFHR